MQYENEIEESIHEAETRAIIDEASASLQSLQQNMPSSVQNSTQNQFQNMGGFSMMNQQMVQSPTQSMEQTVNQLMGQAVNQSMNYPQSLNIQNSINFQPDKLAQNIIPHTQQQNIPQTYLPNQEIPQNTSNPAQNQFQKPNLHQEENPYLKYNMEHQNLQQNSIYSQQKDEQLASPQIAPQITQPENERNQENTFSGQNKIMEFDFNEPVASSKVVDNFDEIPIKPKTVKNQFPQPDQQVQESKPNIANYDDMVLPTVKKNKEQEKPINPYDERPIGGGGQPMGIEEIPIKANNFEELLEKELKNNPSAAIVDVPTVNKPKKKEFLKRKRAVTSIPRKGK